MKSERVNPDQIRFTLSPEELAMRQIKLSELSYGSDKAKALFHDMLEHAHREYGFDLSGRAIRIEAVPMAKGSIMIIITKVNKPGKGVDPVSALTSGGLSVPEGLGKLSAAPDPGTAPETPEGNHFLLRFNSFRDLSAMAALIPDKLARRNRLFYDESAGSYYLEFWYKRSTVPTRQLMLLASEYAAEILDDPLTGLWLQEHARLLLPRRAIQTLHASNQ